MYHQNKLKQGTEIVVAYRTNPCLSNGTLWVLEYFRTVKLQLILKLTDFGGQNKI
jgi:hypothetical protein